MGFLQTIKETISSKIGKYSPWLGATAFYWLVAANDWLSSTLSNNIPGVIESNPFERDQLGHFILHKSLVVDGMYFVSIALTAYLIYKLVSVWNVNVAKAASAGLFVYIAAERLFSAVLSNYLLALRFYVELPQ